jgi:hypothetical protein
MTTDPPDRRDEVINQVASQLTRIDDIASASRARALARLSSTYGDRRARPGRLAVPRMTAWAVAGVLAAFVVVAAVLMTNREGSPPGAGWTISPELLQAVARLSDRPVSTVEALRARRGGIATRTGAATGRTGGSGSRLARYLAALEQLPPQVLLAVPPPDTTTSEIEPIAIEQLVVQPVTTPSDGPVADEAAPAEPLE